MKRQYIYLCWYLAGGIGLLATASFALTRWLTRLRDRVFAHGDRMAGIP